jgi:hypothetical protein
MVGGECTATSDIYTLGVVMYEMIAGRRPYDDTNSAAAALAAMLTTTPAPLVTRAMVTPEVDRLVMRCIENQQADRFQSAEELAAALDELLAGDEAVTLMARAAGSAARPVARVPPAAPGFSFSTTLQGPPPPLMMPAVAPPTLRASPAALARAPFTALEEPAPFAAHDGPPPFAPSGPAPYAASPPPPASSVPTGSVVVPPIGHLPPLRVTATGRQAPITPPGGMAIPGRNLREAYPTIHRPAPSPMRPPTPTFFEERPLTPPSGTYFGRRRGRTAMRIAIAATGLAIAAAAALAIATQL